MRRSRLPPRCGVGLPPGSSASHRRPDTVDGIDHASGTVVARLRRVGLDLGRSARKPSRSGSTAPGRVSRTDIRAARARRWGSARTSSATSPSLCIRTAGSIVRMPFTRATSTRSTFVAHARRASIAWCSTVRIGRPHIQANAAAREGRAQVLHGSSASTTSTGTRGSTRSRDVSSTGRPMRWLT